MIDVGPKVRVDKYLLELHPELNRSEITRLIKQNNLKINGQKSLKTAFKISPENDLIELNIPAIKIVKYTDQVPATLFEDDNVLILDKPAGMLVHAKGKIPNEKTLLDFIKPKLNFPEVNNRTGIVHRLDRATSGVIITAKNAATLKFLQKQFESRKVIKKYLAVIKGSIDPKEGEIDMPIQRNPKRPQTFRVHNAGKSAMTSYRILKEGNSNSLLELSPKTGRTHQLRVHLKAIGHPIVGDYLYNEITSDSRMMLHASELSIRLPGENQLRTFKSKTPSEFNKLVSKQ